MLEGETFLVAAAVLAHQGYLDLKWVILTAFIGGFAADQFCFLVGRTRGMAFLRKRERWQAKAHRVFALMKRFENILVLGLHFLYGFRTVTPFVIGASGFSHPRFFMLNAVGVMAWAAIVGGLGYQFGYLVATFVEEAKKYQVFFLIVFAAMAVVFLVIRWTMRRRARRPKSHPSPSGRPGSP